MDDFVSAKIDGAELGEGVDFVREDVETRPEVDSSNGAAFVNDAELENLRAEAKILEQGRNAEPEFLEPEKIDPKQKLLAMTMMIKTGSDAVLVPMGATPVDMKAAETTARAVIELERFYPSANPFSPKTQAWISLGMASFAMLMPKVKEIKKSRMTDVSPGTEHNPAPSPMEPAR